MPTTPKKAAPKSDAVAAQPISDARKDRDAAKAELDARQAALIEKRRSVKPDPHGDIDQRMAALLADHKEMGAR